MNGQEPLWTRTDYILADLIDSNNGVAWLVANRDVPKRNQSPFPAPYERPGGSDTKPKKTITAAALQAFRERTQKG